MQVPESKAVVVHAGARDSYQLAYALHEEGLLHALVTNAFLPSWVRQHYGDCLRGAKIASPLVAQAAFAAMRVVPSLDLHAMSDRLLSRAAQRIAERSGTALFSYSYYAHDAFKYSAGIEHKLLFQLHPHPQSVRKVLEEEIERTPFARGSLMAEPDLRNGNNFERLAAEAGLATAIAVASHYTASTLIENGVQPERISVVPYGVSAEKFPSRSFPAPEDGPLTVMWLGQLSQRKGISYFLDAISELKSPGIRVLIRGRGNVDHGLLARYKGLSLDIQFNLPRNKIIEDFHRSHVYVLPSLVEGFGQTILEAMSCGVPVITTPNTCGPDILQSGKEGFIIPMRDPAAIAAQLQWCLENRADVTAMGFAAATTARRLTWAAFRQSMRQFYRRQINKHEFMAGS